MKVCLKRLLRKNSIMQKRVTALYKTSLMYTLSTMFQNNVQIQLFQKKLKPNLNKSNKHNISIHLKQVSKQPVVTLGTLKLPSLKINICLHLLSDVQFKNYFIGQASWFSFVKSSKFGISIHYIYLEICDVFVLPLFSICFWNLK